MDAPSDRAIRPWVLAVSCNKGGVGKTTVASNLALYLRALREDLPILIVSLDDQRTLDRMFSIGALDRGAKNLKHAWAERSFSSVIRLGEYGVHYVPAPTDVSRLKARAGDPHALRRLIDHTEWGGIVILDTKSDLEALTKNAFQAADRILVPIADHASLDEAAKVMRILEQSRIGADKARVLLTLVDRRTKLGDPARPLVETLEAAVAENGWSRYETTISRSPRVEMLNSGTDKPKSILHHGRGTAVHGQLRALAEEVLVELDASGRLAAPRPTRRAAAPRLKPSARTRKPKPKPPKSWADELFGVFFNR